MARGWTSGGCLLFLAAFLWLHATQPTPYFLSQYALGTGRLAWDLALWGLAIAGTAASRIYPDGAAWDRITARCLQGVGMAAIVQLFFVVDAGPVPGQTAEGAVHLLLGVVMFCAAAFVAFVHAVRHRDGVGRVLAAAIVVSSLALLAAFLGQVDAMVWLQRITVLLITAWLWHIDAWTSAAPRATGKNE